MNYLWIILPILAGAFALGFGMSIAAHYIDGLKERQNEHEDDSQG